MFLGIFRGNKKYLFLPLILLLIIISAGVSWATREPDVIASITNGQVAVQGDMLANVRYGWYPGQVKEGILRIRNDGSQGIKIDKIESEITIKNALGSVIDQGAYDYKIYAVTLKDGANIISPPSSSATTSFYLRKGGFIDLDYRVEMDQRCGNELQGSQARIAIIATPSIASGDNNDPSPEPSNDPIDEPSREPPFLQVSQGHWAQDCVATLQKHGIITDENAAVESLDEYITRAETAVLLGRALKLKELPNSKTIYIDDSQLSTEARGYIAACYDTGVMIGYELYPGREFRPTKYTPREEMCCVFVRAFNKKLVDELTLPFNDGNDISVWAVNDVKAAVQDKIMVGYLDNTFKPKQPMTRAEAFAIVCRLLGYHAEHLN